MLMGSCWRVPTTGSVSGLQDSTKSLYQLSLNLVSLLWSGVGSGPSYRPMGSLPNIPDQTQGQLTVESLQNLAQKQELQFKPPNCGGVGCVCVCVEKLKCSCAALTLYLSLLAPGPKQQTTGGQKQANIHIQTIPDLF